jgi:DNA repair photolyase
VVADAGADHAAYTLIRPPHEVREIFETWLEEFFPLKAQRVLNLIRQFHGGRINDPPCGNRITGTGSLAYQLNQRFILACRRLKIDHNPADHLNSRAFKSDLAQQLDLPDGHDQSQKFDH